MNKIIIRHEILIVVGTALFILPILNTFNVINISSDLFWSLAGLGLAIEGLIERRGYVHDKEGI